MSIEWERQFRERMSDFARLRPPASEEVPMSIKVGVMSGCFHAEHSPEAYEIIDEYLSSLAERDEFEFVPHESGPELLVYAALGTAGISLAKSVVDLVTTILKARSEGIKRGDDRDYPLVLKVRRTDRAGVFEEEIALEIEWRDEVDVATIEAALNSAVSRVLRDDQTPHS